MSNKKPANELVKVFWVSLGIIFSGAVLVLLFILFLSRDLPSLEQLENYDPDLVTRIYSADGEVLSELFVQKRVFVELNNIPKHMQDAVIASEDRRFYEHWGLSLRSVARAISINILSLSYRQGFSTLTQQLARNLYKTIGFEDSILRKIKEVETLHETCVSPHQTKEICQPRALLPVRCCLKEGNGPAVNSRPRQA